MIKKAALLLIAPFLMVFSSFTFSDSIDLLNRHVMAVDQSVVDFLDTRARQGTDNSGGEYCYYKSQPLSGYSYRWAEDLGDGGDLVRYVGKFRSPAGGDLRPKYEVFILKCTSRSLDKIQYAQDADIIKSGAPISDDLCQTLYGGEGLKKGSMDSLTNYSSPDGSCSVSMDGVGVEFPLMDSVSGEWNATSTGQPYSYVPNTETTIDNITAELPSYLTELSNSTCSDSSSCLTIGDTSYLVDWDSAPDYFEYVVDGVTYSRPDSGGDTGGSTGGDTGGSTGGDTGGSTGGDTGGSTGGDTGGSTGGDTGGSTGGDTGGSTGDDTGGSTGGDTGGSTGGDTGGSTGGDTGGSTGGGSDSGGSTGGGSTVPDFEFDESGIIEAIGSAGSSNQSAINAMSGDITGAISGAFESILEGVNGALDGLVDSLTETFTEDLGSEDDLFDSSGMDETLDGIAEKETQHTEDVQGLMDEIGEDDSSGIADQVASLVPSMPSGGCTPIAFGPIEISCRPFDLIKSWLTWIIYFWTVVSIVDTFFRSGQRTA